MIQISPIIRSVNPLGQLLPSVPSIKQWLGRQVSKPYGAAFLGVIVSIAALYLAGLYKRTKDYNALLINEAGKLKLEIASFYKNNDFQTNLDLLKGDSAQRIESLFEQLAQRQALYPEAFFSQSEISVFQEHRVLFNNMKKCREELFYIPTLIKDDGSIPVLDNGNCFYISVAHLLNLYQSSNQENVSYSINPQDLRAQVVDWMRNNIAKDDTLRARIQNTLWTLLFHMQDKMQQEQQSHKLLQDEGLEVKNDGKQEKDDMSLYQGENAIHQYIERQAQDKQWGSNAEAYVVARLYKCQVELTGYNRTKEGDKEIPGLKDTISPEQDTDKCIKIKFIQNQHHFEPWIECSKA